MKDVSIGTMRKRVNEEMYSIGSHIRTARRRADLTQEPLSDSIGVTPQYLSDLERGLVGTSISTLMKICTELNVSADYILFGRSTESGITNTTLIERIQSLPKHKADRMVEGITMLLEFMEMNEEEQTKK